MVTIIVPARESFLKEDERLNLNEVLKRPLEFDRLMRVINFNSSAVGFDGESADVLIRSGVYSVKGDSSVIYALGHMDILNDGENYASGLPFVAISREWGALFLARIFEYSHTGKPFQGVVLPDSAKLVDEELNRDGIDILGTESNEVPYPLIVRLLLDSAHEREGGYYSRLIGLDPTSRLIESR
ncbi:hypothetical protein HYT57_03000 [Candidatus Woesearchaeota archaeon]|nr:hypothetical protein [Candidatus Woesearchaeota archaeon]